MTHRVRDVVARYVPMDIVEEYSRRYREDKNKRDLKAIGQALAMEGYMRPQQVRRTKGPSKQTGAAKIWPQNIGGCSQEWDLGGSDPFVPFDLFGEAATTEHGEFVQSGLTREFP